MTRGSATESPEHGVEPMRGRDALRARRAAAWGIEPTWDERLTDQLHPVLVRELRQAAGSRLLLLSSGGALLLLYQARSALPAGNIDANDAAIATAARILTGLVAVLCGYLPFRAFASLREELAGTGREQVLLSGLEPSGLIVGKLQGAAVLAGLFLGLSGPVLALCAALRGIEPDLLVALLLLLLASSTAITAVGLALGAALHRLQPATLALSLGLPLFAATGGLGFSGGIGAVLIGRFSAAVRDHGMAPVTFAALLVLILVGSVGTVLALRAIRARHAARRGMDAVPVSALVIVPTLLLAAQLWPSAPWLSGGIAPLACGLSLPLLSALLATPQRASRLGLAVLLLIPLAIAGAGWIDPSSSRYELAPPAAILALSMLAILGTQLAWQGRAARIAHRTDTRRGSTSLRVLLTICVAAGVPLLTNGLQGRRIFEWNWLQALSPPAALERVRAVGFDASLLTVLGAATALAWSLAWWNGRRPATAAPGGTEEHGSTAESAP